MNVGSFFVRRIILNKANRKNGGKMVYHKEENAKPHAPDRFGIAFCNAVRLALF